MLNNLRLKLIKTYIIIKSSLVKIGHIQIVKKKKNTSQND